MLLTSRDVRRIYSQIPTANYTFDTYIYIIGHYNFSSKIIGRVSHITYVVCVNFIHKWRDLQFKVDSERQSSFEFLPEIC